MPKAATKDRTSNYPKLDIKDYHAQLRGKAVISLTYQYCRQPYQQVIGLTRTACTFGNYRYWWLCPKCGRRVGVLYCKDRFICRYCLGVSYPSQLSQPLAKLFARIAKLRRRLNWPYGLLVNGDKPKGTHHTRYNQLVNEHYQLKRQLLGQIQMQFTKKKPKPLEDITLEDIFKELDHAKFMAGVSRNGSVLTMIAVIKARLLGLDKGRLDGIDDQPPLFNILEEIPDNVTDVNFDEVLGKTVKQCQAMLEPLKTVTPAKPKTIKGKRKNK